MKNPIHLHTDISLLEGNFKTKNGVGIIVDYQRLFGYFLQDGDIVEMAYSEKQAKDFLENHKGQIIEPIYYFIKNE